MEAEGNRSRHGIWRTRTPFHITSNSNSSSSSNSITITSNNNNINNNNSISSSRFRRRRCPNSSSNTTTTTTTNSANNPCRTTQSRHTPHTTMPPLQPLRRQCRISPSHPYKA